MALVKLRSKKPTHEVSKARPELCTKASPQRPVNKWRGLGVTEALVLASMAKLKTPPTAPPQAHAPSADQVAATASTDSVSPKGRKRKEQEDRAGDKVPKKRRATARPPVDLNLPGYLRLVDVLTVFPVSRAKWYMGVAKGTYPRSYPLGERAVGWLTADIKALVEATLKKD